MASPEPHVGGIPTDDPPRGCEHGGAFFAAIGEDFDDLTRRRGIVNADVLDAWFPPAPGVVSTLEEHLEWIVRTSPPTDCAGLVRAIAAARSVPAECVLAGAGSSALIFLTLTHWLSATSRVLVLDPMYGEYAHVLEHVIGCRVERFVLRHEEDYQVDLDDLLRTVEVERPEVLVLVNPNSPTGRCVSRPELESFLERLSAPTRVWIDETYIDFAGADQSLERYAASSDRVVVCKSMSKAWALSGLRVAYLCASASQLEPLRAKTPPWAVSLPAQIAAVRALEDSMYYEAKWRETRELREALGRELERVSGGHVVPGEANFLLLQLPAAALPVSSVTARCAEHGVYLRHFATLGSHSERALRIAVKSATENERVVATLAAVLDERGVD